LIDTQEVSWPITAEPEVILRVEFHGASPESLCENASRGELGVLYVIENDLLFLSVSESHQIQAMGSANQPGGIEVDLNEWKWNIDGFLAPRSVQFT
jgi:hypothetical protein